MRFQLTGDDGPPPRPLPSYQTTARALGDRFLALVRPIRVIDAVRWDESIGRNFLAANGRDLPRVTRESYRPLPFDPAVKRRDLFDLEREVHRRLGRGDSLGRLLRRRCRQACAAIDLLACRGTPSFAHQARKLYGKPTAVEDALIETLFAALVAEGIPTAVDNRRTIEAPTAVGILAARLGRTLGPAGRFRVGLSDKLVSDAAASGRSIKLRRNARFSTADLALLEVHEGWVHIGTTLNARRQSVCSFLVHSPPATTTGQEGLAVLSELLAGVSHPARVRRLWRRYRAVQMAHAGADFRDVYRYFLGDTDNPADAYQQAVRTFRGSLPAGAGPFWKDATYAHGLFQLLRAIRSESRTRLALLFTGKTSLADLPLLGALSQGGYLDEPVILPPPFDNAEHFSLRLSRIPHFPCGLPRPHFQPTVSRLTSTVGDSASRNGTFSLLAASESLSFD